MKNIHSNIYRPNYVNLKKAKKNIENNNVIGLPTETVYGLAANAYSNKSVKKIFKLKKRPSFNPLIIHFKDLKCVQKDVICNNSFIKLYKAFCPGPITFILNKNPSSTLKLGQARGVAILVPALKGIPISEYASTRIKKAIVGVGHADKEQMRVMVGHILPKCKFENHDSVDALAVAICHSHYLDFANKWSSSNSLEQKI